MSVRRRRAPRGAGSQLRDEILDAATELLPETGGAKAVSIRSVAQQVGVTPPSIYLHFADKDALLEAVCVRYFEKPDEEMQEVARRAGEGGLVVDCSPRRRGTAYLTSLPAVGDVEEFADRVLRSLCCGHIVSGAIRPTDSSHETATWLKEVADERQR